MVSDAKDTTLVTFDDGDHVAVLTLKSLSSRNALSLTMLEALSRQFAVISHRDDIRVVVLQAEGPAFCAGHDLTELTAHRADSDGGRAFFEKTMRACSSLMQQIVSLPQPVIAAVEGMATAAGCQLVASCDLAVAGPLARFCTPGVDIGLFCSNSSRGPVAQRFAEACDGDAFDWNRHRRRGRLALGSPQSHRAGGGAGGSSGVGAQDRKEISAGDRGRQEVLLRPVRQVSLGGLRAGQRRHGRQHPDAPRARGHCRFSGKARAGLVGRMLITRREEGGKRSLLIAAEAESGSIFESSSGWPAAEVRARVVLGFCDAPPVDVMLSDDVARSPASPQ